MTAAARARGALARLFTEPAAIGPLTFPPAGLVGLAGLGAFILLTVAALRWGGFQDEHAYWLAAQRLAAGLPLYDPTAFPGTPYAYWYPPPLAQAIVPLTWFMSGIAFSIAWTVLLLVCLAYLADWRLLVALALVAFLPVAVELWYRNVHLVLAALVLLALRRSPLAWIPAAAIKVTPVIGLGFLVAARRYRDAAITALVGAVVLAVSVAISPGAWSQFIEVVGSQAGTSGASLVPIPFAIRLAAAIALAVIGGRVGGRRGETLLVLGLVVGNPTLWATAFSLLALLVPVWHRPEPRSAAQAAADP